MPTILEVLNKTKVFFEKKGIEKPRLNAEWLMAKNLDCKRLDLFLRFEEQIPENKLSLLRELVIRRGNHEPLQYLLGEMPFMDLNLKIDSRALIPRPETEELVERLLALWENTKKPSKVLDLGTGSGAIALAIAYYCKNTEVFGIDCNPQSLALAQENALKCALEKQVTFMLSDWFAEVKGKFDWIISNPPYLTEQEWQTAEQEVKQFEPKNALVAADEGLADLKQLLEQAPQYLNPSGAIAFETGILHHAKLQALAKDCGYARTESWKDLSGRDRFFIAFIS